MPVVCTSLGVHIYISVLMYEIFYFLVTNVLLGRGGYESEQS